MKSIIFLAQIAAFAHAYDKWEGLFWTGETKNSITLWDGTDGWQEFNITFFSPSNKLQPLNETVNVDFIDEAWDKFIGGTQAKTRLITQNEERAKIRWWNYDPSDPNQPFDWQYSRYQEWASNDYRSDGWNMNFIWRQRPKQNKAGNKGFNRINFYKNETETKIFDEKELQKVEQYWGAFLNGSWATELEIIDPSKNSKAWKTWRFYMNNTIPLNESDITNTSNTYVNLQMATFANISETTRTVAAQPTFDWDKDANFTHTVDMFEQIILNFQEGNMVSVDPIDENQGYFSWQSFNGSAEPLILSWPDSSVRKQYLNPTNYGNGTYFYFNLSSETNLTQVYYYSGNNLTWDNSSANALLTQVWVDILQGHFVAPFYMFPSSASGHVGYSYEVNLTNNASAIEINFLVEAQNATNATGDVQNATVIFDSEWPFTQDQMEDVWNSFLKGNWTNQTTFYKNGTTELKYWNFLEKQGLPNSTTSISLLNAKAGATNASINMTYPVYTPIDLQIQLLFSNLYNYTNLGFPVMEEIMPQSDIVLWEWQSGQQAPWSFTADSKVQADLPSEWPKDLEISGYTSFAAEDVSANLTVQINGNYMQNNETRAVAEKTWDAFLDGALAEPILWYPSDQWFFFNWTYDVQLRPNTSDIYLDFNVTSDQTNMNATNIAPVYFSSTNGETNLDNIYVQEVVDKIWGDFQNGTWANNATYLPNNMTALRTWQFTEEDLT